MFKSYKEVLSKSREIDRNLGRYVERISRVLWPWRERWLWLLVGLLAVLDFSSTYVLLDLSEKNNAYESGPVAIWALKIGGFPFLLLVDLVAAMVLSLMAFIAGYLYYKHGFKGYARAAHVFFLMPYIIVTTVAVVNNVILLFL